jgi:membrane-bound serine protease (ClpP class)
MFARFFACLLALPLLAFAAERESYTGKVVVIPVGQEDLIARARFEFMSRTLERCTEEEAEAVIFDLDTPGGLLWDTVDLMMIDLQKLPPAP